jgi:hypothetical protein
VIESLIPQRTTSRMPSICEGLHEDEVRSSKSEKSENKDEVRSSKSEENSETNLRPENKEQTDSNESIGGPGAGTLTVMKNSNTFSSVNSHTSSSINSNTESKSASKRASSRKRGNTLTVEVAEGGGNESGNESADGNTGKNTDNNTDGKNTTPHSHFSLDLVTPRETPHENTDEGENTQGRGATAEVSTENTEKENTGKTDEELSSEMESIDSEASLSANNDIVNAHNNNNILKLTRNLSLGERERKLLAWDEEVESDGEMSS